MPRVCLQFVIMVFPDHTHYFLQEDLFEVFPMYRETVLPPWLPGFFINLNNTNNIGRESGNDHLCQNIFEIELFFLVALACVAWRQSAQRFRRCDLK